METPKEYPEAANVRVRDTLLCIAKPLYFVHLFLIFTYTLMLIILEPRVRMKFTTSLFIIIFYGFMMIWLLLFNFICVICKRDKWAVWCNRFVAKIIIMFFPLFFLVSCLHDHFLHLRSVMTFMIYQLIISILMIIFQLYACTCGHHDEPNFVYRYNDLTDHSKEVRSRRKEFEQNKKMKKNQSQSENKSP